VKNKPGFNDYVQLANTKINNQIEFDKQDKLGDDDDEGNANSKYDPNKYKLSRKAIGNKVESEKTKESNQ
jgi:beta-lactamase class A